MDRRTPPKKIPLRILFNESSLQDAERIRALLLDAGYELKADNASDEKEFAALLHAHTYDVVLSGSKLSELKKAEEELKKGEKRFSKAFNALPDAFAILSLEDDTCLEVNDDFLRMVGLPRDAVIGHTSADLDLGVDREEWRRYREELLKNGSVKNFEVRCRARSGEILKYLLSGTIFELDGKKCNVLLARDNTDQYRAIEALLHSEEKFRKVFDINPDAVAINRLDDGMYVSVNKWFTRTMGYTEEEIVGKTTFELDIWVNPEDREKLIHDLQTQGYVHDLEARYCTKAGEIKIGLTSAVIIELEGISHVLTVARDITEQKCAESALRESEAKLAAAQARVHMGNWDLDTVKKTGTWSDEMFRLFGRDPALGMPPLDEYLEYIHPEDREEVALALSQAISKHISCHYEYRIIRRDGSERWIEGQGDPVFDTENMLVRLVGTARDITEQKKAAEALIYERNLLKALMDNTPDHVYFKDLENRFIRISKTMVARFGLTDSAQAAGKTDFDYFSEEHARSAYENEQLVIKTGQPLIGFEEKETWPDGRVTWVSTTKVPLRNPHGQIIGTFGISRDITKRKQAEEALRETEEIFRYFMENSPIYVSFMDEHMRSIRLSKNYEQMLGMPLKDILGKTRGDLFPSDLAKKMIADDQRTLHQCEQITVEEEFNGRYYTTIKFPIIIDGQPRYLAGYTIDITEQRKLQNELLQSQKIQSLGTLAGGIAHDFNNILGIILGYTSIIEKKIDDKKKVEDGLVVINKTVQRGALLVRQILTFARQSDVSFQHMNIAEFIRDIASMLEETFPKVIEIKRDIQADLPFVNADQTQMHQALINLCVNARDAMPDGGTISISMQTVEQEVVRKRFTTASNERYVCISVSDTGTGMDAKTKSRIFDPFFTTKEKGKGTGLGLSVVYGVMQAHRGFVDVESEEGKGTTFFLYLPVPHDTDSVQKEVKTENSTAAGGNETILLAEDEDILRDILKEFLESKGYHVYAAADGREAVELYKAHQGEIGLVLTDVGLPKMTGIEEYRKLREINPQLKVLLASGFLAPESKADLMKSGVKGFIQKPYNPEEILRNIRKVLDE
jgi:PAS domain S-box-containing protein